MNHCQKSIVCICVGLFLHSFFHVIDLFIFIPTSQCLHCYSFRISLEIRQYKSCNIFFILKVDLVILESFDFHVNFRISLSISTGWEKSPAWTFTWITVNLEGYIRRLDIFTILNLCSVYLSIYLVLQFHSAILYLLSTDVVQISQIYS